MAGGDIYETYHDLHIHQEQETAEMSLPSISVPPLPTNFLARPGSVDGLVKALLRDHGGHSETIALTAVAGMGGIGKTVLAQALCRDKRIQWAFPDGIFWQSIGKESGYGMESRLRAVRLALNGDPKARGNEQDLFRATIGKKEALLVIDDVWSIADVEPWLADAPRSRILFTTRDGSIADAVGATSHQAELLSESEAREVFAQWMGKKAEELSSTAEEILGECHGLALAIAMIGAILRSKPEAQWRHTLNQLRSADLEKIKAKFPNYPHPNLFVALQASVDALEQEERESYQALAVLLEEMPASPVMQQTLWGVDADEAHEMANHFVGLSLAQREANGESIRLHDLQLDFLRTQYENREALTLIHGAMRLSSHVISKDSMQFASQVTGRLLEYEDQPEIGKFVAQLRVGAPIPWVQSRSPVLEAPGGALIRTLTGHTSSVYGVEMSGDGKIAVSASEDKTLKVWEVDSGCELRTLTGHTDEVNGVAVSGDGKIAVSASRDHTLKVWEVDSGRELRTLIGHKNPVCGVAVSGDGKIAVSASYDNTLKVWEVDSGRELRTLSGHTGSVYGVAMSRDGKIAVSASDKTLKVWEVDSGRELRTLIGHKNPVCGVAVSGDGKIAISASDNTLKVWEVGSGRELRTLTGHTDEVYGVAMSRDGSIAVSASGDETLKVWEVDSGRELRTLAGHTNVVAEVAVNRDGKIAVSASGDHTLKIWELRGGRGLCPLTGHTSWVAEVAVSRDGKIAVSASYDKTLKVWEVDSGRELRTLTGHTEVVHGVVVSRDGKIAVSASWDHTLKVWEVESGRELRTLTGHTSSVYGVAMSGDGKIAISASSDKTLKVWEVDSGRELRTLAGHTNVVAEVAVSRDGKIAVSASYDKTLKVWEVDSGRELRTLTGHTSSVYGVAMSGDGKIAISASYDKTLKVWEVDSGCELRTLVGHTADVNGVVVSGDGKIAVSASDKTLKVWEVESGREIATFTCDVASDCCAFVSNTEIVAGDIFGRVHFLKLVVEQKECERRKVISTAEAVEVRTEQFMKDGKKHVFLSYCRENKEEVRKLRDDLIAAGETVWWDQDIHAGQDWKFEIRKAMKNAYAVVLCLSIESAGRIVSGIYPEIADAIAAYREYAPGGIFLIPARLSKCEIPPVEIDGTRTLDRLQYQDLFPANEYVSGVQKLLGAIQATSLHP